MTEGNDIPIGIAIEGANRHDMNLGEEILESIPVTRLKPSEMGKQHMCMDKGYDYNEMREILTEFGFTTHIRARGGKAQMIQQEAGFKVRRWVSDRL